MNMSWARFSCFVIIMMMMLMRSGIFGLLIGVDKFVDETVEKDKI